MTSALVPAPYRVRSTARETEDTWTLALEPLEGERLAYAPGQFTMLYCFGAGEVPISISGDPGAGGELVHTVRAVGPVTRAICRARAGDQLGIRGAFGRGWPRPEAPGSDLVIVAGGVGLAPLRPAIYAALAERDHYDRVIVLYGGREPEQLLFRDELEEWGWRENLELVVTVDVAEAGWRGRVGVVPGLIERARLRPEGTTALVCGPEVMMRFSADALLDAGVGPDRIFLSMERNMRCAVGHCGHCQWAGDFVCRDGPVFSFEETAGRLRVREL
jgi:NAD(P)H-flavin reductase